MATTLMTPTATAPAKITQTHVCPRRALAGDSGALGWVDSTVSVERSVCTATSLALSGWIQAESSPDDVRALGIRHTAPASVDRPRVNATPVPATRSNAGVKRKRLPRGVNAARIRDVALHLDTRQDYHDAARASGNLTIWLYLERLHAQLIAEYGALPILDNPREAAHTAA
jgi:hypothetical protein